MTLMVLPHEQYKPRLNIELRQSDSPFIERVWRSENEGLDHFISIATSQLDFVVWKYQGQTHLTLQGPETKASRAPVTQDAESFGIVFKPGVFMPHLPVSNLIDSDAAFAPATSRAFWLNGAAWEIPNFDNADTFVDRLMRDGALMHDPIVEAVLQGQQPYMSLRSVQRRFLRATGMTYRTMQQIQRARQAAILLQDGASILDTVHNLGYFDQAYLTKSLKYFIGQTPSQLLDSRRSEQMSLLYKTASFA